MTTRPDYYSIKALSNSKLKNFSEYSPKKALYLMENGGKETKALIEGRMVHKAVLEPETFFDEFDFLPEDFNGRTKAGKEQKKELEASGKTILTHDQKILCDNICSRLLESKTAQKLLTGLPEVEFFGERDGIKLKSKVDLINPEQGFICDLKTTQNVAPEAFIKECEKRQYFQQAWFYRYMANQAGHKIKNFYFVNIEKEPPFSVSIVQISETQFEIGQQMFEHNFALYKYALKNENRDFDQPHLGSKSFIYECPEWMEKKYLGNGE